MKSGAIIRSLVAHYEKYWQRFVAKAGRKVSAARPVLITTVRLGLSSSIAADPDAIVPGFCSLVSSFLLISRVFLLFLFISFSSSCSNILQGNYRQLRNSLGLIRARAFCIVVIIAN